MVFLAKIQTWPESLDENWWTEYRIHCNLFDEQIFEKVRDEKFKIT